MKLSFLIVCDSGAVTVEGKMVIVGVFQKIAALNFPVVHPALTVAGQVDEIQAGLHKAKITIGNASNNATVFQQEVPMQIREGTTNGGIMLQIASLTFGAAGKYTVDLFIDEQSVGQTSFEVGAL